MGFFTPDEVEACQGKTVRIATLARLDFRSGTQRYWNGHTLLDAGNAAWQPLHGYAMIDNIPALAQGQSQSVTLTLSGVTAEVLAAALAESDIVSQQFMALYFQLFNEAWGTVGKPIMVFPGFMQPPRVSRTMGQGEEGGEQRVSIECVNAFYNRSRPPFGRYTDSDQQRRFPGDRACSYVARTVTQQVIYPSW